MIASVQDVMAALPRVVLVSSYALIFMVTGLALSYILKVCLRFRVIRSIRGPPNPSWLLGHQHVLRHASNVGDYENKWYHKYGAVYRLAGVFSEPILSVSDPKAIQYILHTSGYCFPKSADSDNLFNVLFGPGIGSAIGMTISLAVQSDTDSYLGAQHQHQRRVLNPAFSSAQLRSYLKVFQALATKLSEKITESLQGEVLHWTHKITLDIIGITSFRYRFDAVEGKENVLAKQMENLVPDDQLFASPLRIVSFQGLLRHLPTWAIKVMNSLPSRGPDKFAEFRASMDSVAETLFEEQLRLARRGELDDEKDIINLLAISSLSNDEKQKMAYAEIVAQMATFIVAGHDTTAVALAWLLYELSLHPEDQAKVREEILRVGKPTGEFTVGDYNSLTWLNAVIKESLRLHAFVHTLPRVAARDDVLPLSAPIRTRDGKIITEVPILKGHTVEIPIYMYNKLPSIWGDDAEQWNPTRSLHVDGNETNVGVFANLLTFSAGVRACIGWRFAVLEIQTIISELLSNFEFYLPKDHTRVLHGSGFVATFPLVEGREKEGVQIPLQMAALNSDADRYFK